MDAVKARRAGYLSHDVKRPKGPDVEAYEVERAGKAFRFRNLVFARGVTSRWPKGPKSLQKYAKGVYKRRQ